MKIIHLFLFSFLFISKIFASEAEIHDPAAVLKNMFQTGEITVEGENDEDTAALTVKFFNIIEKIRMLSNGVNTAGQDKKTSESITMDLKCTRQKKQLNGSVDYGEIVGTYTVRTGDGHCSVQVDSGLVDKWWIIFGSSGKRSSTKSRGVTIDGATCKSNGKVLVFTGSYTNNSDQSFKLVVSGSRGIKTSRYLVSSESHFKCEAKEI